ncbi:MAG: hypothetical protein A4E45_01477 [Methanosaeta sp. PtaB.Bin039]|nr:MAG: hypothetical protein A4E45_01477 [Methanosaeta sp. PtaB.Bin039]OPY44253.1 MAG: hypothetical protein A4E47_01672 [Methanosaeta sp. PtaU1.Bin028]HQF17600.1 hypothetical protein [Methanotrichaceae archaeon]HQI92202.1 hypothetical protein [Methanotrichaceae archaeon]HQJ29357.1 hypothetical protein [Methanotrichaceae archaeon]
MRRILAFLLATLLLISTAGASFYLQVQDITMTVEKESALLQVNYSLDSFARLYVLALGARHLEPDLKRLFSSYPDIRTLKANPNSAVLEVADAGGYSNGYYLYESHPLDRPIKKFTVVYPQGTSRTFYNVSATPSVFFLSQATEDSDPAEPAPASRISAAAT